jgi:hypothetical protein
VALPVAAWRLGGRPAVEEAEEEEEEEGLDITLLSHSGV